MQDLNQVVLIGRLVRDAELKYTATAKAAVMFSLAVNESKKNGDKWDNRANYFDISFWNGAIAESLHPYLKKGKQVAITGKLEQERWEKDGYSRSKVTVIASTIQLLGSNSDNAEGQGSKNNSRSAPPSAGDYVDDIPF